MASYMTQGSSDSSKKVISPAEVEVLGDTIKVTFVPYTRKGVDGKVIEVQANWPDGNVARIFPRGDKTKFPSPLKDNLKDIVQVHTDKDCEVVAMITPMKGVKVAEFLGFSRPDGQDKPPRPAEGKPRLKWGSTTEMETQLEFRAYYKLVKGIWAGSVVTEFHRYYFKIGRDGKFDWKFKMREGSKTKAEQSSWGQKLLNMFRACDMTLLDDVKSIPIPEDENILPWLEQRFLNAHRQVEIEFDNGWITDVSPLREDDDEIGYVAPVTPVVETPKPHETGIPAEPVAKSKIDMDD